MSEINTKEDETKPSPPVQNDSVVIHVNEQPVHLEQKKVTGLQIKQAAIAQGVRVQLDFILMEELGHNRTRQVDDNQNIVVHDRSRFQAIPNDDQS